METACNALREAPLGFAKFSSVKTQPQVVIDADDVSSEWRMTDAGDKHSVVSRVISCCYDKHHRDHNLQLQY